jgi:hypothetical protein
MQDRESSFLDALYLGVRDRSGFDEALTVLRDAFDVPSASLLDFDPARPEVATFATSGVFSGPAVERYLAEFAPMDPAPPAFMNQRVGTATSTRRMLPEEYTKPGIFFGEYFRPLGLEECLGGIIASANGRFAMVGLHSGLDRRPFDDEDIARLQALMPHLSRALHLRRSFHRLERETGALSEVCDRLAAGILAFDETGNSLFVNAAAEAMARRSDGFAIDRTGRLLARDRDTSNRLDELIKDAKAGGAGGIIRIPREGGEQPYVAIVSPHYLDDGAGGKRRGRYGTLLVIHDPRSRTPPPAGLLSEMFALPRGAANLLAALAAGEEMGDYGERTGLSMNTVRFHLKSAFARMGVRRQSDLVRMATAALRDLTDYNRDPGK